MSRRKKVYDDCAYCGEYDKLTRDHVIPQCLFIGDLPGNLPKVYACPSCNNKKKSSSDEYLRDLLITDMNSSQSPIAKELFAPFSRAVTRNQSTLARDMLQRSQLVGLTTQSGIIHDFAYVLPEANERTNEIISMIVRGLYYYYMHERLPQSTPIDTMRVRDFVKLEELVRMLNKKGGSAISVGNGEVFECVFGQAHDAPNVTVWILNFYRRAIFVAITGIDLEKKKLAS